MVEASVPLPLPKYDIFRLFGEHPYALSIVLSIVVIFVSTMVWTYMRSQNTTNAGGTIAKRKSKRKAGRPNKGLNEGHFNKDALKNIRRLPESHRNRSEGSAVNSEDFVRKKHVGSVHSGNAGEDNNVETFTTEKAFCEQQGQKTKSNLTGSMSSKKEDEIKAKIMGITEAKEAESDDACSGANLAEINFLRKKSLTEELVEDGEFLGSLRTLHGKLATADINLKARKIEENMTAEEREEEELIRKQQLETIFSLMSADKDKYGVSDESVLEDQLRLYSFGGFRRGS